MEHAVVPAGHLVYAVGDIHGRADLLAQLLDQIKADAAASVGTKKKTIVFVGDYIDRGPGSRRVVDLLRGALPTDFDARFLKGNHEEMMLKFLGDPSFLEPWRINGGAATMESYGVDVTGLRRDAAKPEAWHGAFLAALPDQHRRFFEDHEHTASFGAYLFVHAGVRPGVPIEKQNPKDLLWIRGEFLRSEKDFGKIVVHGHTPKDAPEMRANRIGIDTGAFINNRLTALRLQDGSRHFLKAEESMPTKSV
ncbi:MAG: metallophosphoesterase family protein [Hyphomicrobiaceae bacterium]|nr:metallophosphoesterase family protein [Hyphomicrobiaceae bacterium]MDX2449122.1 metallophosphoesterase family protein [Hyphomicrobiaceae bacterium]